MTEEKQCTFENCTNEVVGQCLTCGLQFCIDHASDVDPRQYCCLCLLPEQCDIKEEPLKDAEGVEHRGRHLVVGSGFNTLSKHVHEMADDELKAFIEAQKLVVRDIERIRDIQHIRLGMAEYEAYERHISVLAKVGGEIRMGTSVEKHLPVNKPKKVKAPASAKPKVDKVASIAATLKSLGITPETLLKIMTQNKAN